MALSFIEGEKIWVNEILFVPNCRNFSEIFYHKNVLMICWHSFLFSINPFRLQWSSWRTALWNLSGAAAAHDKQTSQVNRRPPNSSAVRHMQVFISQNNNKVCRAYSVNASVVPLHCVGKSEGWDRWHSLCVCVCGFGIRRWQQCQSQQQKQK